MVTAIGVAIEADSSANLQFGLYIKSMEKFVQADRLDNLFGLYVKSMKKVRRSRWVRWNLRSVYQL